LSFAISELNASSGFGQPPAFTEIWVSHGPPGYAYTPHPTNPAVSIFIEKGVIVRGGFAGTEQAETDRLPSNPRTRLSGAIAGGVSSHRLISVIMQRSDFVLKVERIEFEDGDGNPAAQGGAAVTIWSSVESDENSPRYGQYGGPFEFIDCRFVNNRAVGAGGAVHVSQASLRLRNCDFEGNSAHGQQHGESFGDARSGAVELEYATLEAVGCRFVGNRVEHADHARGGAIGGYKGGFVHCVNCVFEDNECRMASDGTSATGGAVWADRWFNPVTLDVPSPPIFTNCVFRGNVADTDGGAIHARHGVIVQDCTIAMNAAGGKGGGLHISDGPGFPPEFDAMLDNTILWENSAAGAGHALENQISPLSSGGTSGDYFIRSSCIEDLDLAYWSSGNMNADPAFVNASSGNLRLRPCSPARQAGNAVLLPADDLDADFNGITSEVLPIDITAAGRVLGGVLDMGAHEASCPADINGDGVVNGADMGTLLATWGSCASADCPADLDCNGTVAGPDLGILLSTWGPCVEDSKSLAFAMSSSSGASVPMPSLLLGYLGVASIGAAIEVLEGLSFAEMSAILETFAGSGASAEQ
jgi:predicted outer membrane repeat protein